VVADATIEPEGSGEKVDLEFELSLGEVNEDQSITAPSGAKPLEELFQKLGVNPLELLQGGGAGGLGGLLEGVGGGSLGGLSEGGSSEGGSAEEGSIGGAELEQAQEFTECLQKAETSADIQKCASL